MLAKSQILDFEVIKGHEIDEKVTWIRSLLSDRQQRVIINGYEPEWGQVASVMSLLLYMNTLDSGLSSHLPKFADDSKI